MNKKLIIKLCKLRRNSKNKISKLIVVGYNTGKPHSGFIEKIGIYGDYNSDKRFSSKINILCSINLKKLGYWLSKGAKIKSKPSWLIGLLGLSEKLIYKKKNGKSIL